jgi:dATP pyrophosphohydrolase
MGNKTKKAQVVLAVIDEARHSFEFLLLRTNERRGSFWQNVTGKIEDGETIEEGGLREAIEETNLDITHIVDMLNLGLSYDFTDQRERKVHEECFLIILDQKWAIKLDPHEHVEYQWVSINDIRRESVKYLSNFETLEKASSLLRHWGGR